jgi:hypothetical protein
MREANLKDSNGGMLNLMPDDVIDPSSETLMLR